MRLFSLTQNQCCGYGTDGLGTNGYDCVVIPGALKSSEGAIQGRDKLCGRSKGLVTADMEAAATICSRQCPFSIQFLSDNYEFVSTVILKLISEVILMSLNGFLNLLFRRTKP